MKNTKLIFKKFPILFVAPLLLFIIILGMSIWNKFYQSTKGITEGEIIAGKFDESKFKTDNEWKKLLSPQQYHIVREKGTEIPFTGELLNEKRAGTYYSIGCDQPVFRSDEKYDSGTGWPSFTAPVTPDAIVLKKDIGLGYVRIEVLDQCGGHLGHVFDDGPQPTGKRYCINSLALKFIPD